MGTFQSFRKAYGALKDSTKVGLAKVNSEFKDLDIAIVKATNHVESPPKERHVRKIFAATSVLHPRADVAYCIHALSRRLAKTKSWIVAIKTLIVIHRTLREGDPTFREELVNYSSRGNILQMSYFKDDSSPCAWDCSAWVRTYALFLQERMECFRILKYDIEAERLTKLSHGATKVHSRTRLSSGGELLDQLPALQQLLYRLTACQPEGTAFNNYLVQYALALVLKESFKIYCAINDGIINLVDMFFDMPRHDAVKALNIYKRAGQQAENLADFYDFCKGLDLARSFQFPILRQPPPSFLATMEEYIREAPRISSSSGKRLEYIERTPQSQKPEEETVSERAEPEEEDNKMSMTEEPPVEEIESKAELPEELPPLISASEQVDFLGLNEVNPKAIELEESNALALAIIPSGEASQTPGHGLDEFGPGTSGWELALVTAPRNNTTQPSESKLAGGFDRLLLDSLYDDAAARRQIQQNAGYGFGAHVEDPLGQLDPFSLSNSVPSPMNMQMVMMSQQHMYVQQYPQPHMSSTNPFGDPYPSFSYQGTNLSQGNHSLL